MENRRGHQQVQNDMVCLREIDSQMLHCISSNVTVVSSLVVV